MIVPLKRELRLGSVGQDVVAVKRALRVWKQSSINNTTRFFGTGMRSAVMNFQKAKRLQVDGIYGRLTHQKLAPYFDAYGAWLMANTRTERDAVVAAAVAVYNYHRSTGRVHYTQGPARMSIVRNQWRPPFDPHVLYEDCSSFVTGCYWIARQPDPNGRNYDGYGFTGTLAPHGTTVLSAHPGDLVFYGAGPTFEHVVVAVGDDSSQPTDRCISHGHEGAPELLPISYRSIGGIRSYLPR